MTHQTYVTEPARAVPVLGHFDVVVVGGGIAGVAAAVAAARNGASTCLLEKENALGGLATLGLVVYYLPLCDGYGTKLSSGLAEELLQLSVADGAAGYRVPAGWQDGGTREQRLAQRYATYFNAASYIIALDRFVPGAGVKLYFDMRFCDVVKKGSRIHAVIVESKSGRSALTCGAVVDASGDADVCFGAGEPTVSLKTNVAAGWYYSYGGGEMKLHKLTESFDLKGERNPPQSHNFRGDHAGEVTQMNLASRDLIAKHFEKVKAQTPDAYPVLLPTIPCFRMTRRLAGEYDLSDRDEGRWFEDTVGLIAHWRDKGPVYCVPFRALRAVKTDNLLVAGRCVSAANTGWDLLRVIPACAVTGQAAGTAAALLAKKNEKLAELPVAALQKQLKGDGVALDPALVGKRRSVITTNTTH